MSQNRNFINNADFKDTRNAIILGMCGAFLVIPSGFFLLNLIVFFAGLPLFISYLSRGEKSGLISSATFLIMAAIFCPMAISLNVFLNIILPTSVIGYFSVQHISKNKKTWWYPESLLLRHFVIISIVSLILMSLTFYTEKDMMNAYSEIPKLFLKTDNPDALLMKKYLTSLEKYVKYAVGANVLSNMMGVISNLYIAHLICKKMKINIRPNFDILNLSVSQLVVILPIVALTIAQIVPCLSFICSGLFVVGLFAPMISGFSILHFFINEKQKRSILMTFYIALFIFPLPVMLLVIMVGIIDSFYSVRPLIKS